MIRKAALVEPTVSGVLAADHTRLDALFDDACERVGDGDFLGAISVFHAFANGLRHHIDLEERFVFPVFDARVPVRGPTIVMQHEHRAIVELLGLAATSLKARDTSQFATAAAELGALVAAHNVKEEKILYPRVDGALDTAERAELVRVLERA